MIYSLMALVFVIGYIAIALEHNIHVDKAASALLTAILVWTLLVFGADTLLVEQLASPESLGVSQFLNSELRHHLAEIAEILSRDFEHVRVDLYNENGKIYFGELTFTTGAGYGKFEPDNKFDMILGEKFNIENLKN